jgi:hypothetical protein
MSLGEALKTSPGQAGATDSGWSSMCSSHLTRALAARRGGGCHPRRRMAGIGDRDMVVNNHARAPSPLLRRTGDHLRHDRPLDRRTHGRNRPALARTPAPPPHGISIIPRQLPNAARELRRSGQVPWRAWSAPAPHAAVEQGADEEADPGTGSGRSPGRRADGRKPRGPAWREPTRGHMCSCARS